MTDRQDDLYYLRLMKQIVDPINDALKKINGKLEDVEKRLQKIEVSVDIVEKKIDPSNKWYNGRFATTIISTLILVIGVGGLASFFHWAAEFLEKLR